MPPRSKRKRAGAPARVTRSKAQTSRAPDDEASTQVDKVVNNETESRPGPSTRRARPHLIMEVVLPASKRPTPKTSSALTPDSTELPVAMPAPPDPPSSSPVRIPEPVRESTPQALGKGADRKAGIDVVLPPSSPPPMSSPVQELKWDNSSDAVFLTPTPSPSRSRQHSKEASAHQPAPIETTGPTTHVSSPHPSSPSADVHPELEVVHSDPLHPPQEELCEHEPPLLHTQYSDPPADDDPFGFLAAENRLRERRIQLGVENPGERPDMPSSGGPASFDQSVYEEAFASIFYDPQSGTISAPSEAEPERRSAHTSTEASLYDTDGVGDNAANKRLKRKRTMEVVIPTKGKGKEKAKETKPVEEVPNETSPKPKSTRSKEKGKEKGKVPVLSTYELEAMLPHRIRRTRKPRTSGESIALSDADSDEPSSPPKKSRGASAAKKKTGRGAAKSTKKDSKPAAKIESSKVSKTEKPTARPTKRIRSGEMAEMDDDSRKRFEAERKDRLEAYKALDTYTLEEEEVVW